MIDELCKNYTNLTNEDIEEIKKVNENLKLMAEMMDADVFIDCITKDPDIGIVVSHAKPPNNNSLYKQPVVGKFAYRKNEPAVLRTLDIGMATRDLRAISQENRNIKQNVIPIKNNRGKTIGTLISEMDISESIKNEKNMKILTDTTEQLTETLLTYIHSDNPVHFHMTDGIIIFNKAGVSTYVNPAAQTIYKKLGYINELAGIRFDNLVLDSNKFEDFLLHKKNEISEVSIGELTIRIKYVVNSRKHDQEPELIMFIRDITDIKEKEKELVYKSVAIREIHHRVKNNLQTISSLLRLQSWKIDDDTTKEAFKRSIARIESIAEIHEILSSSGIDDVDIVTMLTRIKNNFLLMNLKGQKIEVNINGDTFSINSDKATAIALVMNELLQNIFKHAFSERESGIIDIYIHRGCMYSSISITDNGVGFNPDETKQDSLGLDIVKRTVKDKLRGNLNIESTKDGTKVMFDFKN